MRASPGASRHSVLYCQRWKGIRVGVIDAIADGCLAVVRRPYLLLPPVALDLWYWLGDRFTPAPLLEALIHAAQQGGALPPATVTDLRALEGDLNLFSLLALGIRVLLPGLAANSVARPWAQGVLDVGGWPLVLVSALGLGFAGLFCLAFYLAGVAQAVRDEPFDLRALARRAPVYWLRLLGLGALIGGLLMLLGLPVLFLAGMLAFVGANPTALLALFIFPMFLLYCYLALAPEAIVVSDVGPLKAVKLSVRIVRRNFWAMLGLLGATFLIAEGFPLLWVQLTPQVAGVPLAIVGNAFLGTGLTAAAMYFYRDRLSTVSSVEDTGLSTHGVQ